jgi:hypothetical protein
MSPDDSYIVLGKDGKISAYVGPDATNLVRAKLLKISLGMYAVGLIPTRGMTITKALKMATSYTGKPYKHSQWQKAQADLEVWIREMQAALPVEISQ